MLFLETKDMYNCFSYLLFDICFLILVAIYTYVSEMSLDTNIFCADLVIGKWKKFNK